MLRRRSSHGLSPFVALAGLFAALALLAALLVGVIVVPLAILAAFYSGFAVLDHTQRAHTPRRGPVAPEAPGGRSAAPPPARSAAR